MNININTNKVTRINTRAFSGREERGMMLTVTTVGMPLSSAVLYTNRFRSRSPSLVNVSLPKRSCSSGSTPPYQGCMS